MELLVCLLEITLLWMIGGRNEIKWINNYLSVNSSIGGGKRFRKSYNSGFTKNTYI